MTDSTPDVLDLEQAACYLKVSPSWLQKSDVPRVRLGRRVVWLRSELLAYAKARLTHTVTKGAA